VVVVTGRHEDDRLAVRGLEHAGGVRRDQRAPRERPEDDRLEVGEVRVVALDRHHRLPRLDPVAVVKRMDRQPVPVVRAELEDRDRLVHPSEHRVLALEELHHDAGAGVVEERGARVVEVRVAVVAVAHLLDREVEDRGSRRSRADAGVTASSRRRSALEARAERRLGDLELLVGGLARRQRRWSSVPGVASARRQRAVRVPAHPAEDLDRAPTAPTCRPGERRPVALRARARRRRRQRVVERQRADEVRAAAIVLLRRSLARLVRPDRDVLGAVVRRSAPRRAARRARARARRAARSPRASASGATSARKARAGAADDEGRPTAAARRASAPRAAHA
jgi:hypothetical protein